MQQNVDANILRNVMRRVPSPVTVITARSDGKMRGMTAGSFTSVSLVPPLVSFNIMNESRMLDVLRPAQYFGVNLLSDEQAHLSHRFALPDQAPEDQFEDIPYRLTEEGVPLLEDTLGALVCVPFAVYEAGDHVLYIGEVLRAREGVDGLPLIYLDRHYRSIGDTEPIPVPAEWIDAPGGQE